MKYLSFAYSLGEGIRSSYRERIEGATQVRWPFSESRSLGLILSGIGGFGMSGFKCSEVMRKARYVKDRVGVVDVLSEFIFRPSDFAFSIICAPSLKRIFLSSLMTSMSSM